MHFMRTTLLYQACNVSRQRVWVGLDEQMYVVGLDSQFYHCPTVLTGNLLNDLLEAVMHWPDEYLAPSLRTEDDMVQDMMDCMLLIDV